MRILFFNWKDRTHPLAGGAEVFTEEVARELVERGHDVTLFVSEVEGQPSEETADGVLIVRRGGRLGVYRAARRFWAETKPGAYDIVVDEINTRPFLTPRWINRTPVVALIHQLAREIWFYETPLPLALVGRYALEPWWLRAYRDVPAFTVSASSAESLRQHHGWRNVSIIPEGWTPHPVPPVTKEQRPTAVFLGRLVAMKRPADALAAFERVRSSLEDARIWVIGDGPLLERLRDRTPAGVEFLGRVPRADLLDRLARAHVLIATSIREGWGLNVSEAAACGTPSIGYAVPGLVDSIRASGGATVEPTPEALGEALRNFFAGSLVLQPKVSTLPWSDVAEALETHLQAIAGQ